MEDNVKNDATAKQHYICKKKLFGILLHSVVKNG